MSSSVSHSHDFDASCPAMLLSGEIMHIDKLTITVRDFGFHSNQCYMPTANF